MTGLYALDGGTGKIKWEQAPVDVSALRPSGHVLLIPIDDFPPQDARAIAEHSMLCGPIGGPQELDRMSELY